MIPKGEGTDESCGDLILCNHVRLFQDVVNGSYLLMYCCFFAFVNSLHLDLECSEKY